MDIYEITYYYNGEKDIFLAYITRNPFLNDNEILDSVKRELYKYLDENQCRNHIYKTIKVI